MGSPNGGSRVGTQFGPYELKDLIGVGGMGEVYRAYDITKDRMVAIKLLRAEVAADPDFQERFRRESRVAARLQEPHVIPVHDFGDIDGTLYIDMRLVEGSSLKDELRKHGALPPERTVSIISQVASALDAAHASGLVHRDIKPENVLLTPDDFAYLVDFGIAHAGGEAAVTQTNMVIGSCAYMATERVSGQRGGPPSDVYSLTCLLYECLTGRPPFEAGDIRQVMGAHMFSPPPRPSIMRRGIPKAFDDVVAKGMAKRPEDRYATAGELARAAAEAAAGGRTPVLDPPPPAPTRQFTAVDLPPAPAPPRARFGPTQVALVIATVVMFTAAAVLAAVLVFGERTNGTAPQTPIAAPPPSTTTETTTVTTSPPTTTSRTPTTTSTPPTTTTTTTSTSTTPTSAAPIPGVSGTDAQGFVGHTARCDAGSRPAAAIRTANSIAIICESSPGSYYYRGERLRDGANLELGNATPTGGGFVVTNPADGARYEVQPDRLRILSNGGVDADEPALEFGRR